MPGREPDALQTPEALIAKTPHDCTLCLEMRGRIAERKGRHGGAARWFGAGRQTRRPLPFTDTDWGAMLLRNGDIEGAIAKFESANQKSPHFADPLEMWGEALIAQEPLRSRAREVRGSEPVRAELGTSASEMGRGA